uniref:Variant surface glycoprotein 1125.4065 n=1 Tax=Trypanosoma brucei TaxID=5691 RepID=A0A1J0R9N5_9TRYP|nr:variant surface glycoprotein 1125.4065 [Trypanosoma brucei]
MVLTVAHLVGIHIAISIGADAKANDACKTPCNCNTRINKLINYHTGEIDSARQALADNQLDFMKLTLSAVTSDGATKAKLLPVLAAAGETVHNCQQALDAADKTAAQNIQALTALAKTFTIYNVLTKSKPALTLTFSAGPLLPNTGIAGTTTQSNTTTMCTEETNDEQQIKVDASTIADEPDIPDLEVNGQTTLTCKHQAATPGNCQDTNSITSTGTIKAVTAYTTNAVAESKTAWNANSHTAGATLTSKLKLTGDNVTTAKAALVAIKTTKVREYCSKRLRDWQTVANNDKFQRTAIQTLLKKFDNEKTSTEPQTQLEQALNLAYGANGNKYAENVWNKVDGVEAQVNQGGKRNGEKLSTITSLAKLSEGLAYKLTKDLEEDAKPKETPKETTITDKDCGDKNGYDCKVDFELIGEICEPIKKGERENKEKDEEKPSDRCTRHGTDKTKCEAENTQENPLFVVSKGAKIKRMKKRKIKKCAVIPAFFSVQNWLEVYGCCFCEFSILTILFNFIKYLILIESTRF